MSFFDDAEAFMKNKSISEAENQDVLVLESDEDYEKLYTFLRREYENATMREIERAVLMVQEQMEKPYGRKLFLKKLRQKLED